jgi:hypothetical protein
MIVPPRASPKASGSSEVFPDPGGATNTAVPPERTASTVAGKTARTGRSAPGTDDSGSNTPRRYPTKIGAQAAASSQT